MAMCDLLHAFLSLARCSCVCMSRYVSVSFLAPSVCGAVCSDDASSPYQPAIGRHWAWWR